MPTSALRSTENGVNGVQVVNGAHLADDVSDADGFAMYNSEPFLPPGWTKKHHEQKNSGSIWAADAVKFWMPPNTPRDPVTPNAMDVLSGISPERFVNANYLDHLLENPRKLHPLLKNIDRLDSGFKIIFPGTRYIGPTVVGEIADFKVGREGREWGDPLPTGVSVAVAGGLLVRALVCTKYSGLIEWSKWDWTALPYPFDFYRDMRIALWA